MQVQIRMSPAEFRAVLREGLRRQFPNSEIKTLRVDMQMNQGMIFMYTEGYSADSDQMIFNGATIEIKPEN